MVFFLQELQRTIIVHPQFLGPNLRRTLREQLLAEVEGMSVDNAGFIVAVLGVSDENLSKGLIDHLSGFIKYKIKFSALMFRPIRNEVVDAVVKSTSDVGFFAEVGPLNVMVARLHIPGDMEFNPEDSTYTSTETGVKIGVNSSVRVKILGASVLQSTQCAIASINEPYLGLLTTS